LLLINPQDFKEGEKVKITDAWSPIGSNEERGNIHE
jgi:hypothetical protein